MLAGALVGALIGLVMGFLAAPLWASVTLAAIAGLFVGFTWPRRAR